MKVVSNVTANLLRNKLLLESNISHIANLYFGSDYMTRKLFRLYSGKEKTAYCAIFKL